MASLTSPSLSSTLTRNLVIAATLVNSILAGLNVNRALVEMPAWQQTGPLAWAAFSKNADLAPTGLILYAVSAFAGALLSIAAVISFHKEWRRGRGRTAAPRSLTMPLYTAALLAVGGLLVTIQAAPIMLNVPNLNNDAAALQRALDGFQLWGNIRGVFQVLAFVANVWSLAILPSMAHRQDV